MASKKQYRQLTEEQVDHFMEHGYVVIKDAFSKEQAAEWTETMWIRLGMDPDDKTTWDRERVHMPWHRRELVSCFAPKVGDTTSLAISCGLTILLLLRAWDAMQDLLGGEDRINETCSGWGDSFIINLGTPELEGKEPAHPSDLDNWHVDGDFFVHFLDSPEQALLVIPIYSDIEHRGGATFISPDGLNLIAKYLSEHPEGVLPTGLSFTPSTSKYERMEDDPGYWAHLKEIKRCTKFVELTGEIGDVVLLHPLMLHTASKNNLRIPRIITNPPVALKEPFNFARDNPEEFSLVELKTLKALGVDKLDFKITTERRGLTPERMKHQDKILETEKERLNAYEKLHTTQPPIAVM